MRKTLLFTLLMFICCGCKGCIVVWTVRDIIGLSMLAIGAMVALIAWIVDKLNKRS